METIEEGAIAGEQPVYQIIPLANLIIGDAPAPDGKMRKSIEQWGVFETVIVRAWRTKFKVIAGQRRCLCIKQIAEERGIDPGVQPVYCRIITDPEMAWAAMVATNNIRRANPLADLAAIIAISDKAMRAGKNQSEIEKQISQELGLTAMIQRKRLKLRSLLPEFRMAVMERRCSVRSAEMIAGMDQERQRRLLQILEDRGESGRLTVNDVKEERAVDVHAYADTLPWDQIAAKGASADDHATS